MGDEREIQARSFMVGDEPHCLICHKGTNSAFLEGFNAEYFRYVAEVHEKQLEGENRGMAAIALRTGYYHALETLFMLMFAGLQAPQAVPGWLLKCRPHQLRDIVEGIGKKEMKLVSTKWKLEKASWSDISELINGTLFQNRDDCAAMQKSFSDLWERFGQDFVENFMVGEYNSFKHGFRANMSTGPTISATPPEGGEGVPFSLTSEFGSNFYSATKLTSVTGPGYDHVFQLTFHHANMEPKQTAAALHMVAVSIKNVVSFLRFTNGLAKEVQICWPNRQEAFDVLPGNPGGLQYASITPRICVPQEVLADVTKARIIERLAAGAKMEIPPGKVAGVAVDGHITKNLA